MKIEILSVGPMQANCYIIHEDNLGVIVDPGEDAFRILSTIRDLGLSITHIVLTHAHYDHLMALLDVKTAFPDAIFCLGHQEQAILHDPHKNLMIYATTRLFIPPQPDLLLKEGDTISVGKSELKVIETPGHTVGSICLLGKDVLLSGDTLFQQGMGRCDLPTGDLDTEVQSILNKLFCLEEKTVVYPGHGPSTTIGFEKKNNEVSLYQ